MLVVIVIIIMVLTMVLAYCRLVYLMWWCWASDHHVTFYYDYLQVSCHPLPAPVPGRAGKGRARRRSLTLALLCALLGCGARWAGGQTLSLVQVKPPLALDAEVLAEAALTRSPTFCNR